MELQKSHGVVLEDLWNSQWIFTKTSQSCHVIHDEFSLKYLGIPTWTAPSTSMEFLINSYSMLIKFPWNVHRICIKLSWKPWRVFGEILLNFLGNKNKLEILKTIEDKTVSICKDLYQQMLKAGKETGASFPDLMVGYGSPAALAP